MLAITYFNVFMSKSYIHYTHIYGLTISENKNGPEFEIEQGEV